MTQGIGQRSQAMAATVNTVNGRKKGLSLSASPMRQAIAKSRPQPAAAMPRNMSCASGRLPQRS